MNTDFVSLDTSIEKIVDKDLDEEKVIKAFPDIAEVIHDILTTGPAWQFNPTNILAGILKDNLDENRSKLDSFIIEHCIFKFENLDVKHEVVSIEVPLELLVANIKEISDEILCKSSHYTITTLFGEINL